MKTIIMAGGKGVRISSVTSDIPKQMIKIDGKPVLEREIEEPMKNLCKYRSPMIIVGLKANPRGFRLGMSQRLCKSSN